jgi:N-glycosylase/DNA lyase
MIGAASDSGGILDTGPRVTLSCEFGERTLWWGNRWQWASASYWSDQASRSAVLPGQFRLGATLMEEVAACVLGGFGMPAAVGLAAFAAVRDAGLIYPFVDPGDIERVLRAPLKVGDRRMRYRFPHQRSVRLAAALAHLCQDRLPANPREARDALTKAPGVGLKTASWIVRNQFDSDEVAIIDVHLRRAGEAAGVFDRTWSLTRDYRRYEAFFLAWAHHARVRPSVLDGSIWAELAGLGSTVLPTRHP